MPKRRCVFTPQLKLEFPFLQDADEVGKIFCTICKSVFSIEHGGRSDITQHVTKVKKHLLALSAASKHEKVTSFFLKNDPSGSTDESRRTAAQEGIFAFHTVIHNHSFRSMDCTSSLLKQMYNKKFTCARTKAESIVLNVLAPFAMQQIYKEIENINFATIMIDTSNHKNLKIVPILIRYFKPNSGIQIKVFEVTNLKGETANILSTYIIESLKKHKLSDKIVAFSGDNCNTNFGGVLRKGSNNVFSILNNNLKTNIFGVGCAAHILHNAMQSSADVLPIDVEIIVNKIFQFFHIYTVRVEHLKEFCEYANVEYKNILGSVKTRWLSLLPAITRIIDIYPGLKSYFEKQEKCPTILKSFFNDPMSIVWFHFLQSQLKVVCDTVTKIEGDKISACEVAEELEILVGKIKNRKHLNFLTTNILSLLNDLKNNNMYNESSFKKSTDLFYNTFLSYVEKWGCHFDQLKIFHWVQLINCPTWENVQKCIKFLMENNRNNSNIKLDEDNLFDEFSHVEQIFKSRIHEWQKNSAKVEVKWCEIFEYTKAHNIDTTNISKIVEYSLAIPGTNAAVERIFSTINVLWTDEKNRFLVETIKSIIIVKTHFKNLSCNEFYNILLKETRLLDEIGSAQKYTKTSKEEIYMPSSSK
ncbi:uncharacterized protein LOC132929545 [Rhopalosiphum padi]|uniref:uncharacterized protein LOC132918289 n=2 Tax=Rhopalosiphum padi TaxID=40932 RepID=UPI00298E13F6|nr:uncharacterized protein LOC132918289 [Rhopalosiphum padi]XP_060835450.1 uncharacterized protein LOC132918303 [Rhopalosiphum padi]XP_060835453.1 uncharacterized protein LOC132918305 [Rhopalosiphum padi]XP_060842971.1 uncharacterized protein LOC132923156 [Rhopalosiphum padi]XP_060844191.1 uncharacterized protein LOC132924106 [Rhopalosiphum padi]XP_060848374.1 uncharacterized protein LOC132927805 [Rhopalosiphum padi]XP_060848389.1 uncharacterized protein LOC132927814 [Rhopalosiphum padi]XP_0